MVTIQRSKGYQTRPTLSVTRIGELIAFIKNIKPDVICMVDNCYGEFVETIEPTNVGADLMVGSLDVYKRQEQLIAELLTLEDPYHCPHGRPTIISLSKRELEKKFKRIV